MANNNRQQAIQEIQRNARLKNICLSLGRDVKHIGSTIKTLCPFHDDHDPSLHIYENSNGDQYHCYACGAHGNVFEFVKKCLGADFSEALSWLATHTGIHLPSASRRIEKDLREYGLAIGLDAFRKKAEIPFNQSQLIAWAKARKISQSALKKADVLCSSSVGLYKEAEQASAEELEALEQAGLLTKKMLRENKGKTVASGYFEAVGTETIIFPIHSPNGALAGFAFHELNKDAGPKYRFNSKFKKSETLYRLNQVWQNLHSLPDNPKPSQEPSFHLYLVEGFMDALRLESLKQNAAAILGSHITNDQAKCVAELIDAALRKGYTPHIHFFLDFDSAGQIGTEKSVLLLLKELFTSNRIFFLDIVGPPQPYNQEASDPDDFLKNSASTEVKDKISNLLVSVSDFLVARALEEDSTDKIRFHWEALGSAGRSQIIFRVQRRLYEYLVAPNKIFDIDTLDIAPSQESAKPWITSLKRALEPAQHSDTASIPQPSIQKPHPDLLLALQKAICSKQTNDFPYDKRSWIRLQYGGPLTLGALADRLGRPPALQEPLMGIFVPKSRLGEPRLKTIPTPEDLIIQQYLLLRLVRAAITPSLAHEAIPAVVSGRFGLKTCGSNDLVYTSKDGHRETVTFAYQIDEDGIDDPAKPLFKTYAQCWLDFNKYLGRKLSALKNAGIKTIYPARLDIKGFYDNLPKYAVIDALKKAVQAAVLKYPSITDEFLVPHIQDNDADQIMKWIEVFCFGVKWYDPEKAEAPLTANPTIGIPQGPDLSAYIANIALFPLDKAMQEAVADINERGRENGSKAETAVYARYVDDIVIYAVTEDDNRKLQKTLSHQLQHLQLTLSDKTTHMEPMHVTDLWQWTIANRGFGVDPSIEDETLLKRHNLNSLLVVAQFGQLDRAQMLSILHDPSLRSVEQTPPKKLSQLLKAAAKTSAEVKHNDRVKFASHIWRLFAYRLSDNNTLTWESICEELEAKHILDPFRNKNKDLVAIRNGWFYQKYDLLIKIEGLERLLQSRPYLNPTINKRASEKIAACFSKLVKHIGQDTDDFWNKNFEWHLSSEFEVLVLLRLANLQRIICDIDQSALKPELQSALEKCFSSNKVCWLLDRLLLTLKAPYTQDTIQRDESESAIWHYFHAAVEALINHEQHNNDDEQNRDPLAHLSKSVKSIQNFKNILLWKALYLMLPMEQEDQPTLDSIAKTDLVFIVNCVISVLLSCLKNDFQQLQQRNYLFQSLIENILPNEIIAKWQMLLQPPSIVPQTFLAVKLHADNEVNHVSQLFELKFSLNSQGTNVVIEDEVAHSTWNISSNVLPDEWAQKSDDNLCFTTNYRHSEDNLKWQRFSREKSPFERLQTLAAVYEPFIKQLENTSAYDHDQRNNLLESAVWTKWGIFHNTEGGKMQLRYAVIESQQDIPAMVHFWGNNCNPTPIVIPSYFMGYWRFGCALFDHFGLAHLLPTGQKDDYHALTSIGSNGALDNWLIDSTIQMVGRLLIGRYFIRSGKSTKQNEPYSVSKAYKIFSTLQKSHPDTKLKAVNTYLILACLHLKTDLLKQYIGTDLERESLEAFRMVRFAGKFFNYNQKLFEYFHEVAPVNKETEENSQFNRISMAWQQAACQIECFRDKILESKIEGQTEEYNYIAIAFYLKSLVCQMREVVFNVLAINKAALTRLNNQSEPHCVCALAVNNDEHTDDKQFSTIVQWLNNEVAGVAHPDRRSQLEKITPSGWLQILYVLASESNDLSQEELDKTNEALKSFDKESNFSSMLLALEQLEKAIVSYQSQIERQLKITRSTESASNLMIDLDDGFGDGFLKISIPGRATFTLKSWAIQFGKLINETASPANPTSYLDSNQGLIFSWSEVQHQGRTISIALTSRGLDSLGGLTESKSERQQLKLPKDTPGVAPNSERITQEEEISISCVSITDANSIEESLAVTTISNLSNGLKNSSPNNRELWTNFRMEQESLWGTRKKRNSNHVRVAFCQWNIDDSYQWPGVEACLQETSKNGLISNCCEHRRRLILKKIYDVCKKFNVDALLLPEYSVRPETVAWLAGKDDSTDNPKGIPFIWAGTYRLYPNQTNSPVPSAGWHDYSSLLSLVDTTNPQNIEITQRLKRYPSVAANEFFWPSTDQSLKPLSSSPADKSQLNISHFVMELVCSENFILTSPLNAPFVVEAVYALQKQIKGGAIALDDISACLKNDIAQLINYLTGTNSADLSATGFKPKFYPRRSLLFVPAMSTRVEDFIALGLANLFSNAIATIICNAVSSFACGGSCLIGPDALGFHKNKIGMPLPLTPYNGLLPGVFTGNKYGGPLGDKEEAVVIVDIDPINPALPKPRPTLWPPSVKLVAHLPIVEWYDDDQPCCKKVSNLPCKRWLGWKLKPFSSVVASIKKIDPLLTKTEEGNSVNNLDALCHLAGLIDHSPWQQAKMEAFKERRMDYPVSNFTPAIYDWIDCEIDLTKENDWPKTLIPAKEENVPDNLSHQEDIGKANE